MDGLPMPHLHNQAPPSSQDPLVKKRSTQNGPSTLTPSPWM